MTIAQFVASNQSAIISGVILIWLLCSWAMHSMVKKMAECPWESIRHRDIIKHRYWLIGFAPVFLITGIVKTILENILLTVIGCAVFYGLLCLIFG